MEGDCSTPFSIEWVPEILSQSKFGELTLQFQFGHQRQPVHNANKYASSNHSNNVLSSAAAAAAAGKKSHKKMKVSSSAAPDTEVKDLQNLKLDYSEAPLNDSEFQELTKSVP